MGWGLAMTSSRSSGPNRRCVWTNRLRPGRVEELEVPEVEDDAADAVVDRLEAGPEGVDGRDVEGSGEAEPQRTVLGANVNRELF